MNIWAVIPTKPFDEGKARLAGVLDDRERRELNQRFLERTLDVALEIFPSRSVVVVSRAERALEIGAHLGAHALQEGASNGLNAALTLAAQFACDEGADGVLAISCDLPLLQAADLQAMLDAVEFKSVVIAPDRWRSGTNGLLVAPAALIEYAYGPESLTAHREAGVLAGVQPLLIARRGLAFDIDTPQDLAAWRSWR